MRQDMGRGRTKAVVVETRKRRLRRARKTSGRDPTPVAAGSRRVAGRAAPRCAAAVGRPPRSRAARRRSDRRVSASVSLNQLSAGGDRGPPPRAGRSRRCARPKTRRPPRRGRSRAAKRRGRSGRRKRRGGRGRIAARRGRGRRRAASPKPRPTASRARRRLPHLQPASACVAVRRAVHGGRPPPPAAAAGRAPLPASAAAVEQRRRRRAPRPPRRQRPARGKVARPEPAKAGPARPEGRRGSPPGKLTLTTAADDDDGSAARGRSLSADASPPGEVQAQPDAGDRARRFRAKSFCPKPSRSRNCRSACPSAPSTSSST